MPEIVILYWEPGSGGDFIQQILLDNADYHGVVEQFCFESTGRLTPQIDILFKNVFDHDPGRWYHRHWSLDDCKNLIRIIDQHDYQKFIIPTHDIEQVKFLKKYFISSVSVGITYPKNMYPLILKNLCKKVEFVPGPLYQPYSNKLLSYFKQKNVIREFVLRHILRNGNTSQQSVDNCCDINISLEKIYAHDLSDLNSLIDTTLVNDKFDMWLLAQNQLHQKFYPVTPMLLSALGYNSQATAPGDLEIELDQFDRTLIFEHCRSKNLPISAVSFKTLKIANDFLSRVDNDDKQ